MSWHTGRLALFDVESTGVDPHRDRIVTAAVVEVGNGQDTFEQTWLADPGIDIPQQATDVHGITTEHARTNGEPAALVVQRVAARILGCTRAGVPVVGHNVCYDLTILRAELVRHDMPALADQVTRIRPVVDTLVLDKWLDPYRPKQPTKRRPDPVTCGSRTLIDCCRIHGVTLTDEDAHGAPADALAAGRLAYRLAARNEAFQHPLADLHAWQTQWKAEQAASLQAWFDKQGVDERVSLEWPVQSLPEGWTPDQLPVPPVDVEAVPA